MAPHLLLGEGEGGCLDEDGEKDDGEAIGVGDMHCSQALLKNLHRQSEREHDDKTGTSTRQDRNRNSWHGMAVASSLKPGVTDSSQVPS